MPVANRSVSQARVTLTYRFRNERIADTQISRQSPSNRSPQPRISRRNKFLAHPPGYIEPAVRQRGTGGVRVLHRELLLRGFRALETTTAELVVKMYLKRAGREESRPKRADLWFIVRVAGLSTGFFYLMGVWKFSDLQGSHFSLF